MERCCFGDSRLMQSAPWLDTPKHTSQVHGTSSTFRVECSTVYGAEQGGVHNPIMEWSDRVTDISTQADIDIHAILQPTYVRSYPSIP